MAKNGYAVTDNVGSKAIPRLSSYQYPIAGSQVLVTLCLDIDRRVPILHKEVDAIFVVIGNRGLEGNGQAASGLSLRQIVDGMERGDDGRASISGASWRGDAATIANAKRTVRMRVVPIEPAALTLVAPPDP